jgi:hypothetical protein
VSAYRVRLWDRAAGKEVWSMPVGWRELVVLSPDRKILLTAPSSFIGSIDKSPDVVLKLWDAETGKLVRTLRAPAAGPHPSR